MRKNNLQNIIYDTLMQNTQHEQLDINDIQNPCISDNEIVFDYKGHHVFMRIMVDEI